MIKKYQKLSAFLIVFAITILWQFVMNSETAYAQIEYVGGVTASGRTSTYDVSLTSLTGGLASSPSEGDVVLILTGYGTNETDVDLSVSGFTELADLYAANPTTVNDSNMYAGYKIMGASPDTSVTVAGSGTDSYGGTTIIQVWRGVDQATPIDVTTTTAISTTTMFIDPPANTPANGGARVVALYYGTAANCDARVAGTNMTDYNLSVKGSPTPVGNGTSFSVVGSVFTHDLSAFNPSPSTNALCTGSNYSYAAATVILRPALPTPAYVANGTASLSTGTNTRAWPTHEVGDIGLLIVESDASEPTLSNANGFVKLGSTQQDNDTRLDVFWARATSTTMGSPTLTDAGDHTFAFIMTFRGVVPVGNPFSAYAEGIMNASTTAIVAPAVTTTEDGQFVLVVTTRATDSSSTTFASGQTNANLAGLVERYDNGNNNANGGGLLISSGIKWDAGDTGTTAITYAVASHSGMMTIAFRPVGNAPTIALNSPADGATAQSSTPTFNFTATDIEADTVEYQIQIDNNNDFSSPALDKVSETDSGFTAGHPFASGVAKDFTVQAGDALSSGTYYWRVRALDTTGSNAYGDWSSTRSFSVGQQSEGTPSGSRSLFKFGTGAGGIRFFSGRIIFR